MNTLCYLWSRRTTVFGYFVVILGVLAVSDGIFSPQQLKWIVLLNGIIVACMGHYNNDQLKKNGQL